VALLRERRGWDIGALALILGGAIANILDRSLFEDVIDFLDFQNGDFRPFLIFNPADAAISVGAVIYLARALFMPERGLSPISK
jgi:signal peptidase II